MEVDAIVDLARQSMVQTLVLAGPMLAIALIVGGSVAVLQAVTQVQDITVSLVPKILAVMLTLAICLPWFVEQLLDFSRQLFGTTPTFVSGG